MAAFIDNIKFPLSNLNINNLMLINFEISLKTKRLFRSFDRHSDKTATLSKLLPNINKFPNKILDFFQKVCTFRIQYFLKKSPPVNSSHFNGSQNWVDLPIFYTLCRWPCEEKKNTFMESTCYYLTCSPQCVSQYCSSVTHELECCWAILLLGYSWIIRFYLLFEFC